MAIVEKRGNGYSIRVSAGYNSKGKQIRKNFTWTPDPGLTEKQLKKELQRQIFKFEELVSTGRVIDGNIKFSAFAEKWIELHAEKMLAPKTVFDYKRQLIRINEGLGHIRLDRLQPAHLLSFYDNLSEKGVRLDIRYKGTEKLKQAIEAKEVSYKLIGKDGGISESTVMNAYNGQVISRKSADGLAKSLGQSQSALFEPVNSDLRLSGSSIQHYHRQISSILSTAVEWQVIPFNPAERVRAPRVEKKEAVFLDDQQARDLVELLESEPLQFKVMVIMLIYTGLRRGEICALKWSDIDFKKSLLHVRKSAQYLPKLGVFEKSPKSGASMRVIKLPTLAKTILLEHKNAQKVEADACGDQWHSSELILTRNNGLIMLPDEISRCFRDFIRRKGLPNIHLHSLRHTNATLMISAGTDIRTVSNRLGHAQTSTTMNIYAHAIRSADEAAAEALDNILNPIRKAENSPADYKGKELQKTEILAINHK